MSSGESLCVFQCRAHHAERAVAFFGGLRDVIGIAGHSVADDFRDDMRVAALGVFERFEHQNSAAFANDESIAVAHRKGGWHVAGSSLRVESACMAANPPTPIGVMVASVPPQIIISAAPRSIILKESPMACAEAEQAVAVAEFGPLRAVANGNVAAKRDSQSRKE